MTKGAGKNVADSVRARLQKLAKEQGTELIYVLTRYGIERLLYRLSVSQYADRFLLKGAMLLVLWTKQSYRPTLDVDLLASGDASLGTLRKEFEEIAQIESRDDGLEYVSGSMKVETIKEGQQYEGVRITFRYLLGQAVLPVQVDIAYGDAVTPQPARLAYPTLLELPEPVLLTYPRETVVAEKFEAMVKLGMANSRMKDFSDLYFLAKNFDFDGGTVIRAIEATFNRRKTEVPSKEPLALTAVFYENAEKQKQWLAFVKKTAIAKEAPELSVVCIVLREFLLEPCAAAAKVAKFDKQWTAGGGWK